MKRPMILASLTLSLLHGLVMLSLARGGEVPVAKASTALVDITPSNNGFPTMFLAGFEFRNNKPAVGTLPNEPNEPKEPLLTARALALQDGSCTDNIKVIVTADILGFPHQLRHQILADVLRKYGLARQNLLLAASHTHSGPVLTDNLDPEMTYMLTAAELIIVDNYTNWLKDAIVTLIGTAINGLSTAPPVTLSYGVGTVDLGFNRLKTPSITDKDNDVPVLAVRSANDNSLLAVVFGYACHPLDKGLEKGQKDLYYYHPDYPGVARQILEQNHGGMAFFIQGTAGDIDPDGIIDPGGSSVAAQGDKLALAVKSVLTGDELQPVTGPILTESRDVSLPLKMDPTDNGHLKLRATYVELQKFPMLDSKSVRHATQMIDQIDRGVLPETEPWPVAVWHFGATDSLQTSSLVLVALGGEVVSHYSLFLKNRFHAQLGNKLWVAAYSNEVPGYIPSNLVWDLPLPPPGGSHYEAGWGCPSEAESVIPGSFCEPLISSFGVSQMFYGWPAPLKRGNSDTGGTVKGVEELVIEQSTSLIENLPSLETTPPTLTLQPALAFWPPNHKYRTVTVARMVAGVSDDCDTSLGISNVVIEKVTSDEPDNAHSDGNTTNDIVIAADCRSVQLRAERDGTQNGRVYSVTLRVEDVSGNVTKQDFKVSTPINQSGAPAVHDATALTRNSSCL